MINTINVDFYFWNYHRGSHPYSLAKLVSFCPLGKKKHTKFSVFREDIMTWLIWSQKHLQANPIFCIGFHFLGWIIELLLLVFKVFGSVIFSLKALTHPYPSDAGFKHVLCSVWTPFRMLAVEEKLRWVTRSAWGKHRNKHLWKEVRSERQQWFCLSFKVCCSK